MTSFRSLVQRSLTFPVHGIDDGTLFDSGDSENGEKTSNRMNSHTLFTNRLRTMLWFPAAAPCNGVHGSRAEYTQLALAP
jgi:hypothetical protein